MSVRNLTKRTDAKAGAALGTDGGVGFRKGRPGDVQMRPRNIVDEFLQNQGGGDGAAVGAANIFHVGDAAFDRLTIFFHQRQLPQFFTASCAQSHEVVGEGLMVAKDACDSGAQRDHAGAGQSRQD